MPAADFKTVPDELLHVAEAAEAHFLEMGFDVAVEEREIGFPFVPALVCRQRHEVLIVDVFSAVDFSRVDLWTRYCMSQAEDTRYCAIVRTQGAIDQKTMKYVTENRLGLGMHDDHELVMVRQAGDLAVHVRLPEIKTLPRKLRPLLAPAFQKIRDGDWRDGLGDAYLEVEQRAREYLTEEMNTGRVSIVRGKAIPRFLTTKDIERMTLGQLAIAFSEIQKKNQKDSLILSTLTMINETRKGLAHSRRQSKVEGELRLRIGRNIYAVIACLEQIVA
jgi:hypothetical protein